MENNILKEKCSIVSRILNSSMMITLPRNIIRDYIDGGKFATEIPCNSEGQELTTDNW